MNALGGTARGSAAHAYYKIIRQTLTREGKTERLITWFPQDKARCRIFVARVGWGGPAGRAASTETGEAPFCDTGTPARSIINGRRHGAGCRRERESSTRRGQLTRPRGGGRASVISAGVSGRPALSEPRFISIDRAGEMP